jgi:hypothetical protein
MRRLLFAIVLATIALMCGLACKKKDSNQEGSNIPPSSEEPKEFPKLGEQKTLVP